MSKGEVEAGEIKITPSGQVTDSATGTVTPLDKAPMMATTLPDGEVGGQKCYVLQVEPKIEGSPDPSAPMDS